MYKISYCSNVHAGATLAETEDNLLKYAVEVRNQFSPRDSMPVGLWLSNQSACELVHDAGRLEKFGSFLTSSGLSVFTFNGFPFGNFHQDVVKHKVYHPTWYDSERLEYTRRLVRLIDRYSEPGDASISTLPIAWGNPKPNASQLQSAGLQLQTLAVELADLRERTGKTISICIEPEPGCLIQTADTLADFYQQHLIPRQDSKVEEFVRHHIRVCHDVCHSVVMGESQQHALKTYHQAGILIGKVQVSSAVCVDFATLGANERKQALDQLRAFAEDRYLHQTTVHSPDSDSRFYEDLPLALAAVEDVANLNSAWRIHFHVPVYLEQFGHLRGSRDEIVNFLAACREYSEVEHFEVETYAWNVLPRHLRVDSLSDGIAKELAWFSDAAQKYLEP